MKFELETHPGVIMIDPTITIVRTIDDPIKQTFEPHLLFTDGDRIKIYHVMPEQPYVNGTWLDNTVSKSVETYLKIIALSV